MVEGLEELHSVIAAGLTATAWMPRHFHAGLAFSRTFITTEMGALQEYSS
jgi:hypothetical protein